MAHVLSHLACPVPLLPPMGFVHSEAYDATAVRPVKNMSWNKPSGGLWVSPLHNLVTSAWTKHLLELNWSAHGWDLLIHPVEIKSTRILRINSHQDLLELNEVYGLESELGLFALDFEAMAEDWDGLYLTEAGQRETCSPLINSVQLYSWDLTSLVLFHADADFYVGRPAKARMGSRAGC